MRIKTKRNELQPVKVSVSPSSVQKAMSSGGSGTTEVMSHQKTAGGRLLQARAAATGNARSPSVERLVGLTTRVGESADCSLLCSFNTLNNYI